MRQVQLKRLLWYNPENSDVPDKAHHFTYRVFPFCPGIAWKIKDNKFVRPSQKLDSYMHLINKKDLVVTAYGELLESVMSLSLLEMLNHITPESKLYWSGDTKYQELIKWQGLAQMGPSLPDNVRHLYPTPIFQDRNNRTYFNCLHNYKNLISWDKLSSDVTNKILPAQIFQNSCVGWNVKYLPQFRNFIESPEFFDWQRRSKFDPRRPSILIIPDDGYSIHTEAKHRTLDWFPVDVKRLADLTFGSGLQILVLTHRPERYYHSNINLIPTKLNCIFSILKQVKYIMSRRIDWLIMGLMYSNATIISHPQIYDSNLINMREYFGKSNVLEFIRDITPEMANDWLRNDFKTTGV